MGKEFNRTIKQKVPKDFVLSKLYLCLSINEVKEIFQEFNITDLKDKMNF